MARLNGDPYHRYVVEINKHDLVTAVILAVVAVIFAMYGVVKLAERSRTECVIELSDGSKVEDKSCMWWNRSNTLSCADHKRYSMFAVKSWECK
jgi:hypothetical protein